MAAIFRKELTDYFSSIKLTVIMLLTVAGGALALYGAYNAIRGTLTEFAFLGLFTSQVMPSVPNEVASYLVYPNFMTYILMPVTGILLGFNAINKERAAANRLVLQPVYRDNIINAKFLAGIFVLMVVVSTSILLVAGYGLRVIGVTPNAEELLRLFFYAFSAVIYGAFWMGLSMIFSSVLKNRTLSLIIPLVIWIVMGVYVFLLPRVMDSQSSALVLMRIAPMEWFTESSMNLLIPQWSGMSLAVSATDDLLKYLISSPQSFGQSLTISWAQIISTTAAAVACLAVNFALFVRKSIRFA